MNKENEKLINGRLLFSYIATFLRAILWPAALIVFSLLLRYSTLFQQHITYNSSAILAYISILRWPVVAIIILVTIKPYLPELFRRLRKFGAGPVSGELAPASPQISDTEALKGGDDSNEPASSPEPADDMEILLTSPDAKIAYERVYAVIFGTQLALLKRLHDNIPNGLPQTKLADIYDAHKTSSPNAYPSFIPFVQYLIDNSLVLYDPSDENYKITNAGVYFLKYLSETNRYELYKSL